MPLTKVLYGQELSDLCRDENLFAAADLNGIGITDILAPGNILSLPEENDFFQGLPEVRNRLSAVLAQKSVAGQTWSDIVIQELGDESYLFDLADSNQVGITDDLAPSTKLNIPTVSNLSKQSIVSLLRDRKPCSLYYGAGNPAPQGIEYWGIEIDFVVN
jgi:hypothetical protein